MVLSNPEFLAEGTAVHNLTYPDRVLIGGDEHSASGRLGIEMLRSIYLHWVPPERIMVMSTWSSELSKLVSRSYVFVCFVPYKLLTPFLLLLVIVLFALIQFRSLPVRWCNYRSSFFCSSAFVTGLNCDLMECRLKSEDPVLKKTQGKVLNF